MLSTCMTPSILSHSPASLCSCPAMSQRGLAPGAQMNLYAVDESASSPPYPTHPYPVANWLSRQIAHTIKKRGRG